MAEEEPKPRLAYPPAKGSRKSGQETGAQSWPTALPYVFVEMMKVGVTMLHLNLIWEVSHSRLNNVLE